MSWIKHGHPAANPVRPEPVEGRPDTPLGFRIPPATGSGRTGLSPLFGPIPFRLR